MDFVTLQIGDVIGGRYELLEKIGAGAFGAVFRARQLGIDRIVAVKLLMPEAADVDGTAVARFSREARLSSSLEHPNTITIHDYGQTEEGVLYLVMEFVRGESLQTILRKETKLSPIRVVKIIRQILLSLHEAHSRGIVHRDMKPGNIMLFDRVGAKDVVKVLDFGIAKFVTDDNAGMDSNSAKEDLTVAGRIIGTPRYMSPEQINGQGVFPASDLYALALIFYEMIAGRQAVEGTSTLSLIAVQISAHEVIAQNDPLVPEPLREIINKASAKELTERYQSAMAWYKALEPFDDSALVALEHPQNLLPGDTSKSSLEDDYSLQSQPLSRKAPLVVGALGVSLVILIALSLALNIDKSNDGSSENIDVVKPTPDELRQPSTVNTNAETPPTSLPQNRTPSTTTPSTTTPSTTTPSTTTPSTTTPSKVIPNREITLSSSPDGAKISRGDEPLGNTPLTISFGADEVFSITASLNGYKPASITISPDIVDDRVSVRLIRKPKTQKKPAPIKAPKTIVKPKPKTSPYEAL